MSDKIPENSPKTQAQVDVADMKWLKVMAQTAISKNSRLSAIAPEVVVELETDHMLMSFKDYMAYSEAGQSVTKSDRKTLTRTYVDYSSAPKFVQKLISIWAEFKTLNVTAEAVATATPIWAYPAYKHRVLGKPVQKILELNKEK